MRTPLEIKKLPTGAGLLVIWPDGVEHELSSLLLRQNCPAADSRAARGDQSHEKPLTAKKSVLKVIQSSVEEETTLQEIWPVGNYAIGLRWADGHDNGIYTFDFLFNLGSNSASR